jgi:hypothetical protein
MSNPNLEPVPVHVLITRRDVGMGIRALRSLLACNDQPLRIVWHEEALDDRDVDRINEAFPEDSEVIRRRSADEVMDEVLRDYPLCREYRRRHFFGLKLIDSLHDPSDRFMVYDTDVLTMKPVAGLSSFPDDQTDFLFMSDSQYSYVFNLGQALSVPPGVLLRRLNSGCMLIRRSSVSYAQIESVFEKYPWLREMNDDQTPWALMASKKNARMWNPAQVGLAYGMSGSEDERAVLHFTQPVRTMFLPYAKRIEGRVEAPQRVLLQTVPGVRFGGLQFFCEILTRRLINFKNRMRGVLAPFRL